MLATATPILLVSFPIALIAAALSDAKRFIIPNWTSLLLIGGFAVAYPFTGMGFAALLPHLAMFAGALTIGFILFAIGVWGAGDGKLIAAVAIWFQPEMAVELAFWIVLIGGAIGAAVLAPLVLRKFFPGVTLLWKINVDRFRRVAPYGVAIAIGGLIAFPESVIFRALM